MQEPSASFSACRRDLRIENGRDAGHFWNSCNSGNETGKGEGTIACYFDPSFHYKIDALFGLSLWSKARHGFDKYIRSRF